MSDENRDASQEPAPAAPFLSRELKLRIASGVAFAVVAALALWAGPVPFALLVFAISAAMSWEWNTIVRSEGFDAPGVVHLVTLAAAALLTGLGMAGLAVAVLAAGAIAVSALLFGGGVARLSSLGVFYTGLPLVALVWLRSDLLGLVAVVYVLVVVVATDVAAYATGRLVGGPKLWPRVSPGKTWSGLIGGVLAAAVAAVVLSRLTHTGSARWMGSLGIVLALVAQGGDLAESAFKRSFGLKDASSLIPGHGGFLDRMDGLVTAAVLAALVGLFIDAHAPARALLYGE